MQRVRTVRGSVFGGGEEGVTLLRGEVIPAAFRVVELEPFIRHVFQAVSG